MEAKVGRGVGHVFRRAIPRDRTVSSFSGGREGDVELISMWVVPRRKEETVSSVITMALKDKLSLSAILLEMGKISTIHLSLNQNGGTVLMSCQVSPFPTTPVLPPDAFCPIDHDQITSPLVLARPSHS